MNPFYINVIMDHKAVGVDGFFAFTIYIYIYIYIYIQTFIQAVLLMSVFEQGLSLLGLNLPFKM